MELLPNEEILYSIINRYNLSSDEISEFIGIIKPIYIHEEFQKRMGFEFTHHGNTTLGEHIIETTITTYIIAKKKRNKININMELVLKISIFHDLYTNPWQNSTVKEKRFSNAHGFRHPIEGVINAISWFPEMFSNNEEARIIIDGMIHHMYPLPVARYIDDTENHLGLRNFNLINNLNENQRNLLIQSSNRGKIGRFSLSLSLYPEGRIICYADKKASIKDFKLTDLSSITALVTGKNKGLLKK